MINELHLIMYLIFYLKVVQIIKYFTFAVNKLDTHYSPLLMSFQSPLEADSPERDTNSQTSVHSNSQEGEHWCLLRHNKKTTHEETGMERDLDVDVHSHSQRNCHGPNQEISHRQRHNQAESGFVQGSTSPHGPDHQHIAQTASHCNEHFKRDVNEFSTWYHCAYRTGSLCVNIHWELL